MMTGVIHRVLSRLLVLIPGAVLAVPLTLMVSAAPSTVSLGQRALAGFVFALVLVVPVCIIKEIDVGQSEQAAPIQPQSPSPESVADDTCQSAERDYVSPSRPVVVIRTRAPRIVLVVLMIGIVGGFVLAIDSLLTLSILWAVGESWAVKPLLLGALSFLGTGLVSLGVVAIVDAESLHAMIAKARQLQTLVVSVLRSSPQPIT